MQGLIFDFDDGDFFFQTSSNTGMDNNGNLMLRMSDNMAMDINSGELHFTSAWEKDDDD